jgi:hypothetical protein
MLREMPRKYKREIGEESSLVQPIAHTGSGHHHALHD